MTVAVSNNHSSAAQSNFRVLKDRAREQLAEAYSRCITVSAVELTISSSVQGWLNT